MIKRLPFLLLAVSFLLSSCGPPKKVTDMAIKEVETYVGDLTGYELKDFKVEKAERRNLSDAEIANGIEDYWCIVIKYIASDYKNHWIDRWSLVSAVRTNGNWDILMNKGGNALGIGQYGYDWGVASPEYMYEYNYAQCVSHSK